MNIAVSGTEPWTLERALEQALAHNPDDQLARHRIAAAQAGVDQANAAFWPRVQLQSSYTRTDNPTMVFGSIRSGGRPSYCLGRTAQGGRLASTRIETKP
jgi:outer membrane protein TolC